VTNDPVLSGQGIGEDAGDRAIVLDACELRATGARLVNGAERPDTCDAPNCWVCGPKDRVVARVAVKYSPLIRLEVART
jgi:hypothetical protein